MGKVEIGIYFCVTADILKKVFIYIVSRVVLCQLYEFCPNRWCCLVAMATERLNFWRKKIKHLLLRCHKGDEAETLHKCSWHWLLHKLYFLLLLPMCSRCYGNLKFIMRKVKVGLYCYLTAGILAEWFYKCLLSSPAPSIKKLYKFLILICCHGNWKSKMLN